MVEAITLMSADGGGVSPSLPCILNDPGCAERTREVVRSMAYEIWVRTLNSPQFGKGKKKQELINEGMERIIRTAMGDYAREIFNAARASFHVEFRYGNRIKHAYQTGDDDEMTPDSCIIPTFRGMGRDFVLMYKMNMSSIAKNASNAKMNMSGEIHEFHRTRLNLDRHLALMNLTPTVSYQPLRGGRIIPEKVRFRDQTARHTLLPGEVPGTFEHRSKTQTTIVDMRFDWHPDVLPEMTTLSGFRNALLRLGPASIRTDTMDLSRLDALVLAIVESYDPLNEFRPVPLEDDPFPEPTADEVMEFEYPC